MYVYAIMNFHSLVNGCFGFVCSCEPLQAMLLEALLYASCVTCMVDFLCFLTESGDTHDSHLQLCWVMLEGFLKPLCLLNTTPGVYESFQFIWRE